MKKEVYKNQNVILVSIVVLAILGVFFIYPVAYSISEGGFKVDALFLKSVIKQGESLTRNLKITNLGSSKDFQINIKKLQNLVFLSEDNFELAKNELKDIEVKFEDRYSESPGVYVGALVLDTGSNTKEIPIILEVQSREILFATNLDVAPKYKEVEPGEQISVGIKLFNLKDTKTHSVEMNYLIKNLDGDTVISETESVVVGTESLVTKTITLPEDISLGVYVFAVIAKYEDSASTSSYLFDVVKKKKTITSFDMGEINYFVILIFAFLFGILALVAYMVYDRNRMFRELRKQHVAELRFYMKKIEQERRKSLARAKTKGAPTKEKKKIVRKFKKIKKKAVKKIKARQKEQNIIFKKLTKQKKRDEMKSKLQEWKKQGFNVKELIEVGKKEKKQGKSNIKKWKEKGYDTSIIGR